MKLSNNFNRIKSIDGLRGLSCIIIAFVSHYFAFWKLVMPNVVTHIHPELFVEVFVGISGFCLIHKYNRGINDNIFKFWGKRYIQIMPLFWITVSIMIIFDYVVNGIAWISSPYPISFFKQYVGLSAGLFSLEGHANGALWTIDLLLICYIFFWLYIKLRNWNRWGKLLSDALLAIILLISLYGMVHWWNKPFLYYVMSLRVYASFIVGIIVYNVLQMKERVYRLLYLFGGGTVYIMLRLIYEKNIYVDASIIFTPLMLILATEIRPTKLLLECSFFQMVGKLSMSIYFWHPVARAIIKTTEIEGTLVGLIFYIILTVLFSVVSNDFIEKPIKRLLLKMYRKG